MENNKNRIVQSLYLCTTNSREKMQQSIVENILYTLDSPLTKTELFDFIKSEFHIEIDEFELAGVLSNLSAENLLFERLGKFALTDNSKQSILKNVLENEDIEKKRKERIAEIVKSLNCQLNDEEVKQISNLFNEYIYDSFLEYGRNAIKYFMPFNQEDIGNGNILKEKIGRLQNQKQKQAFINLVSIYPNKLTKEELDYLDNIAIKSEYFFSLGVPEDTFNKSQDFKLNGLVILVDTNFIYSILGLHSHRQNENCNQIISLISSNRIDCRLVFIRKTLQELQNARHDFDRSITTESFTFNQIKTLLDSDRLNAFSREYFEKKLIDPETPHPSEKIKHSQKILSSKKIQIFNYSFPHLEDPIYLNAKFTDYYDYLNIKNEARAKHGLHELLQKDDKKLEHDIYLREAVISLRKDKNTFNDLNYLCLSLDSGLIDFDRFANTRHAQGREDIAPNFILPSVFLRKIRPFIPIITDDYKKAFITSITTKTIDTTLPQYSEAAQRSMTYFKKLGIDDYNLIISIIKQELFFKEFSESEKEDKQEEFIRSEIDRAYEQLKKEKEQAKIELIKAEEKRIRDLDSERNKIDNLVSNISDNQNSFEQEKVFLLNQLNNVQKEKETIEFTKSLEHIYLKEKLLIEKNVNLKDLTKQRIPIIFEADRSYTKYLVLFCLIVFAYFIALAIITFKVGWNKMEPITYFLGAIGLISTYIYPAISGMNFNPQKHFEQKKIEFVNRKYSDFNFNIERFESLKIEVIELERELDELRNTHKVIYPN